MVRASFCDEGLSVAAAAAAAAAFRITPFISLFCVLNIRTIRLR